MPPSTRPATPGPSSQPQVHKRYAGDALLSREAKKPRIDPQSPETRAQRDSNRDNSKRRRKRKKKVPIVIVGSSVKSDDTTERSGGQSTRSAPTTSQPPPNEIIRYSSMAPEAEVHRTTCTSTAATPALPTATAPGANAHVGVTVTGIAGSPQLNGNSGSPSTTFLEEKVAQLTQELTTKNELLKSHQALLTQVQQAITCQICLELMYKPFALSPCGHLACYDCLVQWFKAPPQDDRPVGPVISRQKTCPHCRGVVRERPIEVWDVKGIVQSAAKSKLVPSHLPAETDPPANQNNNPDPWGGIFPKIYQRSNRIYPWFISAADDGDGSHGDRTPRGEYMGMLDMEDGGIYRCFDCFHEIWDGVCTSCGRLYPGHRPNPDDDDNHSWPDDGPIAEEVDVVDDPGWLGLEGGDGDDVGDEDYHDPLHMHRHFWVDGDVPIARFYHDELSDDYEDDDDVGDSDYGFDGRGRGIEVNHYEDDDRYESDFIDDEVVIPAIPYVANIYEISDSGGEDDLDDGWGGGNPRPLYGARRITDSDGSEGEDSDY